MNIYVIYLLILPFWLTSQASSIFTQKTCYPLSSEPIDVVIPCHHKDLRTLDLAIEGIKNNGKNIRRIMVISEKKFTNNAEWIDEAIFPFSKEDVALEIFRGNKEAAIEYLNTPDSKIGWIFAQLLKMYSVITIPDISSNVLIVDADTIFLNPVEFLDKMERPLYNPGFEKHTPYFEHGERLLPGFKKMFERYSGISHHILFQRAVIEDMFQNIQEVHNTEPWRAMCQCIDVRQLTGSAMAEYELYFNFAFAKTNQVKVRRLKWKNLVFDIDKIKDYQRKGYHYVSCHSYII